MIQRPSRRGFLRGAAAATLAWPFYRLLSPRPARAVGVSGGARRFIVFYFPDGVAGPSQNGEPSLWHASGSEQSFSLPGQLEALVPYRDHCVFLNGLSMGAADSGSHPGGAKKLLTATDGGMGRSIDQHLAATVGAAAPHRHLYLGVQAGANNATGDKHISYPSAGFTTPPEDDPRRAFARLFGDSGGGGGGGGGAGDPDADRRAHSVIDTALADLHDLRGRLGPADRVRLDHHLEALREVEARIGGGGGGGGGTCDDPALDTGGLDEGALYAPEQFPAILRAQTDLMVQAMACDLTRVGVIQCSYHTSELVMSRFAGTEMHDPGFDMRSHQASHYGPAHDQSRREFRDFYAQRRWFVAQFARLLEALRSRPEGDGTMLDYSVVLLCTEVSDGNTHSHDDMPFVVAGGGGGRIRTGRLLSHPGRRHGDLLLALARAMGNDLPHFGDASAGPLPGLLA
jgi:hypothetical protein